VTNLNTKEAVNIVDV